MWHFKLGMMQHSKLAKYPMMNRQCAFTCCLPKTVDTNNRTIIHLATLFKASGSKQKFTCLIWVEKPSRHCWALPEESGEALVPNFAEGSTQEQKGSSHIHRLVLVVYIHEITSKGRYP